MFNPYYLTALPSWVLQPLATGAASVQASFGGSHSSALSLSVLDERVSLSSLALSVSGVTSSRGNTLDAIAGTTRAGAANALFSDGTQLPNVFGAVWVPQDALVRFETSDARVVDVAAGSGD